MAGSDDIIARAEEALRRHSGTTRLAQRAAKRKLRSVRQRVGRIALLTLATVIGVFLWGLVIGPVGVTGVIAAALLLIIGALALAFFPRGAVGLSSDLPQTELAMLPLRTEEWLFDQRKLLPPPAQRLVDGIGVKLEILSDQLRTLDEKEPAAQEIRKLVAQDLPELVNGYGRVPAHLRKAGINGISPDAQVVEGLNLVDSELARMSAQIASGDLDQLATQKRYLEIKYQGAE